MWGVGGLSIAMEVEVQAGQAGHPQGDGKGRDATKHQGRHVVLGEQGEREHLSTRGGGGRARLPSRSPRPVRTSSRLKETKGT